MNYTQQTFDKYDAHTWFEILDQNQSHTFFSQYHDKNITFYSLNNKSHKKIPTILLNTEKDSEQKNKILQQYNFVDCYYFYHALAAVDWFRGYEYAHNILPIRQRTINKKFITFNRITGNSRIYRAFFVTMLAEKKLLDDGHISFSKECPVHGNLTNSIFEAIQKYQLPQELGDETIKAIELLPILRIDSCQDKAIKNSSFTVDPIPQSMESFVQIVTETCFWDKKKHLTEKIFKPIVLKQPFILLGCVNNLAYLKEYGFKTFDRWWDESYDQCQDPLMRMQLVVKILENLSKLSNHELFEMLCDMEEVLEHNFNLFFSKKFVSSIWHELEENLTKAFAQLPPQTYIENQSQNHPGTLFYTATF